MLAYGGSTSTLGGWFVGDGLVDVLCGGDSLEEDGG